MSLHALTYSAVFLALSWLFAHSRLIPNPIPGVPFNRSSRYMPWGELVALGIYNFRTGEVFSWLSLQCHNLGSPLIQLFIPPFSTTHPILVLADLPEIEDIVTRRTAEIDRADMMYTWFGLVAPRATIGLKSTDKKFQEQRRLWNVVLSPKFLEIIAAERFFEAACRLCDLWKLKAKVAGNECAFDAQDDLRLATLDAMWKMCTGTDLALLDAKIEALRTQPIAVKRRKFKAVFGKCTMPPFYNALERLLTCLDWVMQGVSPRAYTWLFRLTGILGRAERVKNAILDDSIASAKARLSTESGKIICALDEVIRKDFSLRTTAKRCSDAASDAALRDELLELLITGHETTASSIAWAIKYLTDHPHIQLQLRKSIFDVYPACDIKTASWARELSGANLPYLDAVVYETLRLSNTGPVSFRQTLASCDIMGHQIPIGTPIILVTAGPSYNGTLLPESCQPTKVTSSLSLGELSPSPSPKAVIQNPYAFQPDRWLVNGIFDPNAVKMLPFSAGSRGCFGKKIALLEMKILITVLVSTFDFPLLEKSLSSYDAWDGLTRRPTCCNVRPMVLSDSVNRQSAEHKAA